MAFFKYSFTTYCLYLLLKMIIYLSLNIHTYYLFLIKKEEANSYKPYIK